MKNNPLMIVVLFMALSLLSACGGGGGGEGSDAEELSAPAAPTGVSAVLSGEKTVSIQWDQVPGAEYYSIYMSESPGVAMDSGYKASGFGAAPFVCDGTPPGTYYFVVTATNPAGESVPSVEVSVTVTGDPIVVPIDGVNQGGNIDGYPLVVTSQGISPTTNTGGVSGTWVHIWAH